MRTVYNTETTHNGVVKFNGEYFGSVVELDNGWCCWVMGGKQETFRDEFNSRSEAVKYLRESYEEGM